MSSDSNQKSANDGAADAFAATTIIAIVVFTMYFWLSGMPT
jgi:hypothetical protein